MIINRNNVFEVISKANLKPEKDYGQNYLLDEKICEKIVSLADIKSGEKVLEIGPGLGSLTHFIVGAKDTTTTLVDIDQRMIDFLKVVYQTNDVKFVCSDIRKHDVSGYNVIIGNLPYNITTELVEFLLLNASKARRLVLMCQSEAAERFISTSGKEYGPTSILIHLFGVIKKQFVVRPGSFYPAPKCASTVFTIDLDKNEKSCSELSVCGLIKKIFINRRKTIFNNLTRVVGDKDKAMKMLEELNIPLNKRPEELSPDTYLKIYEKYSTLN